MEADAHGGRVARVMNAAEIHRTPSVTCAEGIERGVEPAVCCGGCCSFLIDWGLEQGRGVIVVFDQPGESDPYLEERGLRLGAIAPQVVEQMHEAHGGIRFAGGDFGIPCRTAEVAEMEVERAREQAVGA
jgi:hypothetical protein